MPCGSQQRGATFTTARLVRLIKEFVSEIKRTLKDTVFYKLKQTYNLH